MRRNLVGLALLATMFSVVTGPVLATAVHASTSPVVVSLTFDDAVADQYQALAMLNQYGLHATMYVNSGRLGSSGYMTTAQVQDFAASGNEIGGHTVSHADLPALDPNEQARQICNDRVALLNAGFQITDFAYPYGDTNPQTEQIVAQCGYNSARGVGNLVSPGTCFGCPYSETIPPRDPYHLATPDSVKQDTTLDTIEGYVTQAQTHGGGWVPLLMHHICVGCDYYSIAPSTLDSFLQWLTRKGSGVVVETVHQVIGGSVKAPVAGPPPNPPASDTNVLNNPSLETDSNKDGTPDCWQRGQSGTNSFTYTRTTDAHTGTAAESINVSSFTSGDRRFMTQWDLGSCAPSALPGHAYNVSAFYKTNAQARLVAYFRNTAGGWNFFSQGPLLPAASTYTQATWTTPTLPEGTTAISVGVSIRSTGFVTVDDFGALDTDQTPPTVALAAPSPFDGAMVRGTLALGAVASDNVAVDHVDFLVNGATVCADVTVAPYTCSFDTTQLPDSTIAVTARAVDTANHVTLATSRSYTIGNSVPPDTTNPQVDLSAPAENATLTGDVTLSADASDNDAVAYVDFLVNGNLVGSSPSAPYAITWDSSALPDGPATVQAQAFDRSGNTAYSATVNVTVANVQQDTTPPTSSLTCTGGPCDGVTWSTSPVTCTLTATDDSSGVAAILYTLDGSDPAGPNGQVYSAPLTLSSSATLKFEAVDHAGNYESAHTQALLIDTQPPTNVSITAPLAGATVTGTTAILTQESDNVGIARVRFYLDGVSLGSRIVAPFKWNWATTTATKGPHSLTIVVTDPAGNTTTSAPVSVTVG